MALDSTFCWGEDAEFGHIESATAVELLSRFELQENWTRSDPFCQSVRLINSVNRRPMEPQRGTCTTRPTDADLQSMRVGFN